MGFNGCHANVVVLLGTESDPDNDFTLTIATSRRRMNDSVRGTRGRETQVTVEGAEDSGSHRILLHQNNPMQEIQMGLQ
jgi:hypothetical protein